jgi:tetratricopeptide (TPR) repeat protein
MNPHDDRQDEQSLTPFLKAVERDMAPPDSAFLQRLRAQSADVYQQSFARQQFSRRRLRLWLRAGIAAAVVAAIGAYLLMPPRSPAVSVPFAEVLKNTAAAGGLHLKVVDEGTAAQVWVQDGRLRRERADGTYEVARRDKLWVVDEKENRVTAREGHYFGGAAWAEMNLLGLLLGWVRPHDEIAAELSKERPTGRITKDGTEYLVYRLTIPGKSDDTVVEVLVHSGTLRLASARASLVTQKDARIFAELLVMGYGEKIDEDKFVVKDTLTEDGRVGKVADVQGVVSVRPILAQRWTPIGDGTLLRPGDWVRTDLRGANATLLRLSGRGTLTLGPGSLVEVVRPDRIRVHHGDVEADVPAGKSVELVALDGQSFFVKGKVVYRFEEARVVRLDKEPGWLKGFKGSVPQESLGSLLAKVDGRNVPLSVGYHKVAVDVRDQVARTTIEESFVNHTDAVLEGVFHFPLPQDASISGFGMWIGDNLVEADVVEKQRAREIFEIILTEKRDPGLLEWTGGNIFKARVYPIPARSEKRVKITYTQVLPLRGGQYRYGYALQSEMLRQHPLRQLDIDVKVHSALPLRNVTCPTHTTRSDKTDHSAHVEFTAQEYTPTRDFEVVVEVETAGKPEVVVIPHRRGEDGYFLMQISPPAARGSTQRGLLSDGAPLRLLVVADTSASMDAGQRSRQAAFVAALLSSLTPRDSFNLGCCDVDCDWAFDRPQEATPERVTAARQFLARRVSLGWTDLDRAFVSAFRQCDGKTNVLYVGDGIVTTGDADPTAFARRLRRLHQEQGKGAACHAVALGSSFEPAVIQAIASLGGSARRVAGGQGPVSAAREWLEEVSRPALRDLKVEFKGLRTARVYPEEMPNLPAGSQQILLGRYLPEGKDQAGEVVVTGRLGDKPVSYRAKISLKDAEEGNAFVPRLWARMYLDTLLAQGSSPGVRDEIIALSEEFQIITPYTSLLVLESDADRERFGVKRRFKMRDGEEFFAQGRDNVNYELLQKQMKQAGGWRLGLRRQVLRQLASLGRNARALQVHQALEIFARTAGVAGEMLDGLQDGTSNGIVPMGAAAASAPYFDDFRRRHKDSKDPLSDLEDARLGETTWRNLDAAQGAAEPDANKALAGETPLADPAPDDEPGDSPAAESKAKEKQAHLEEMGESYEPFPGLYSYENGRGEGELKAAKQLLGGRAYGRFAGGIGGFGGGMMGMGGIGGMAGGTGFGFRGYADPRPAFDTLFPSLPAWRPYKPAAAPAWPEEARRLARELLRSEWLRKDGVGVEVLRQVDDYNAHRGRLTQQSRLLTLFTPGNWLTRAQSDRTATLVQWCDARERGVFSQAFQLGRTRAPRRDEARTPPLELRDFSLTPLEESYPGYAAAVERPEKDRAVLLLRHESSPDQETRLVIDTGRNVLLSVENRHKGKVTWSTTFDDFAEAAGCWWARKVEVRDEQGRRLALETLTVRALTSEAVRERIHKELAARESVQFLHEPLPRLADAKRALKASKAGFDDRIALLRHFAASQRWARALEHLEKAEALTAGKPGVRWLHIAFLNVSRRHEELKGRLLAAAGPIVKVTDRGDAYTLAEHLMNQTYGVLPPGEMLELLDRLRPVYEAVDPQVRAMQTFLQRCVAYLVQVGRNNEGLRLQKQLAIDYPDDVGAQRQYAQALGNSGDFAAAFAWLNRVLKPEARWLPDEEEALRDQYAALLYQQGQYAELAEYLAAWVKREPASTSPYLQYLSALIRIDKIDRADALMTRWLREGQAQGELSPAVNARFQAAVAQALGRGHNMYTNRVEERWLGPLAEVVRCYARRPDELYVIDNIMQSTFLSSDACRRVRKQITEILDTEVGRLSAGQLQVFVRWALADDPGVPAEVWQRVANGLRKRWAAETKPVEKNQLGQALVQVVSSRAQTPELLDFLHLQFREGPKGYHHAYAGTLFETLLAQPWSAEYEDEALALLKRLSAHPEGAQRLHDQVAALYRLTDVMVEARYKALMARVEHPEKLTRSELKAKEAESRKQARAGFAQRLRAEADKHRKALTTWLAAERIYLEVLTGRDPKAVAAECWAFLGNAPTAREQAASPEEVLGQMLDSILQHRFLSTVEHLAVRKDADTGLVKKLLAYVDKGVAAEGDDGSWKLEKFRLLVALDRPKELEPALREWAAADDSDSRWRIALAYLLAEQGRVAEAAGHFEAVEKADELDPAAYRALADWYMALNRRDAHDRALLAAYRTLDEWSLSRAIGARLQVWQHAEGHPPSELDRDVMLMFTALFEKASHPANYMGLLQQFYQATRDFRLLAVLADAVVGHSAGRVYPFLQGMQAIVTDIHDEATVDQLAAHIAALRSRAKTAVDRRALDLLEAQVRRRAAELKNQPGPHTAAALAALRRAFTHEWSEGEPRLMADLLAGLGANSQEPLAKEQLRQLEALHGMARPGTEDRLHIAQARASTLWAYGRRPEAVDQLGAALKELQDAHDGALPAAANNALSSLVGLHEAMGHHARAEKLLRAQLRRPDHEQQALWLTQHLYTVCTNALAAGAEVSLGKDQELYTALERTVRGDLGTQDANHRYQLVSLLCRVYRTAGMKKLRGVADDVRGFAFGGLAEVLRRQSNNYDAMVGEVAGVVHDLLGAAEAVAFLLDRVETEPAWLRYNNQDGWSRHAWSLGQWRAEAKVLPGGVEDRLLKFVLAELRSDLQSRHARNRVIYYRNYQPYYWSEKEQEFAKAAEVVLALNPRSGAAVTYVAEYLSRGVNRHGRAVEVLLAAHKDKLLNENGQDQLVTYLHEASRYAESIAVLMPMVAAWPETLRYRLMLMRAYFHADKKAELLALLKDTDAFFHDKGRWTEAAVADLANTTLETRLHEPSVAYFKEVISLHERTAPRRGLGDGVLSGYYAGLARAFDGLGKTAEAAEAAGGAVVAWGPDQRNRAQALTVLHEVLWNAPDLDGYVAWLDRHEAATGLYNALIHKEIGRVYVERGRHQQAIAQLRLAVEVQPNDAETQKLLVAEYDALHDPEGAFRQLLQAAELSRRDIKLYQEMGKRLDALGRPAEVERAYTSIVEMLPNESEGHALLAEIRQTQNRWGDAISHWEQVARIRALEPTGLLRLGAAQVHERLWEQAEETVKRLRSRSWPARFGNVDQQIRDLEQQIDAGRKSGS